MRELTFNPQDLGTHVFIRWALWENITGGKVSGGQVRDWHSVYQSWPDEIQEISEKNKKTKTWADERDSLPSTSFSPSFCPFSPVFQSGTHSSQTVTHTSRFIDFGFWVFPPDVSVPFIYTIRAQTLVFFYKGGGAGTGAVASEIRLLTWCLMFFAGRAGCWVLLIYTHFNSCHYRLDGCR